MAGCVVWITIDQIIIFKFQTELLKGYKVYKAAVI